MAAIWPSGRVPERFAAPVSADVPVLLGSGTHDPSTAPRRGAEAARHLPNGLHVVIPSGHGVCGPAVRRLDRAFLERGSVEGLVLKEVEALELPPLERRPSSLAVDRLRRERGRRHGGPRLRRRPPRRRRTGLRATDGRAAT